MTDEITKATCAYCGRDDILLNKNGKLRYHSRGNGVACYGSRQEPAKKITYHIEEIAMVPYEVVVERTPPPDWMPYSY